MKKLNDKSLVIKKETVVDKFLSIFKNIFFKNKKNSKQIFIENEFEIKKEENIVFQNSQMDFSLRKLLNIQEELEQRGINEENLRSLTKDLSDEEKEQLKNLYIEQRDRLKSEIEIYKKKILAIKAEL